MKLKIDKDKASIRVELATDTAKKPLVIVMTPDQVRAVMALLSTSLSAEKLVLDLEL